MTHRLTEMAITRVSVVDKGANQRRIAVLKRDEEGSMTELAAAPADATPTGIAAWLRKAADVVLGKPTPVAKTATFAEIVAGQELSNALYDSWSTLQDALWTAIYGYDENGVELSMEAKQALVAQDLDEFKTYLLAQMASGIQKSAGSLAEAPSRHVAAIVAKVGRKISGSRLERLQAAAEALTGVLAEVVEETATEADTAEEEPVDKAELQAAIAEAVTKAQEPILAEIAELKKAAPAAASTAADEGDDTPATLDTVVEVVGKLADRLEAIEKAQGAGGRTSVVGQDGNSEIKKRSVFTGMF